MSIEIAVLVVNYNGLADLQTCLPSLSACSTSGIVCHIVVIDNASADGSVAYVRKMFPSIRLVILSENKGYVGGNNVGWHVVRSEYPNVSYIYLLNADTAVDTNFLEPLVAYLQAHPECAAAQSKLLLYHDRSKINSLGNVIHYLGFGYSSYCNIPASEAPHGIRVINYGSGASVMIRCTAIDRVGLFDEGMFMYLEDLDLGWRLALAGFTTVMIPKSIVFHKYDFDRGMKLYYYFERNRLYILLKNYRLATLIMLLPALISMEIGQIAFALVRGRVREKLKTYAFFFNRAHMGDLLQRRHEISMMRRRDDREIIARFSGTIDFQPVHSLLVKYVVNPVFNCYFGVIKHIIFW